MRVEAPNIDRQPGQFLQKIVALNNPGEEAQVRDFFAAAAAVRDQNPDQWFEPRVYRSRVDGQLKFQMKTHLQMGQKRKQVEETVRAAAKPLFEGQFRFVGSKSNDYIGGQRHIDNPNLWVQTFGDPTLDDPMHLIKNPIFGQGEGATVFRQPGQFAAHLRWLGKEEDIQELNKFRLGLHDFRMLNPGKWVEGKAYLGKDGEIRYQVKVYLEKGQKAKAEKAKLQEVFDQFMPRGRERLTKDRERLKIIGSRVNGFVAGELDIDTSKRWVKTIGDPNYFIKSQQEKLQELAGEDVVTPPNLTILRPPEELPAAVLAETSEPGLVRAARFAVAHGKAIRNVGRGVAAAAVVGGVVWGLSHAAPVDRVNAAQSGHSISKPSEESVLGLSMTPSHAPAELPTPTMVPTESPAALAAVIIPTEKPTQPTIPAPTRTEQPTPVATAVIKASPLDQALNEFLDQEQEIGGARNSMLEGMKVADVISKWDNPEDDKEASRAAFIGGAWRIIAQNEGHNPDLIKPGRYKPGDFVQTENGRNELKRAIMTSNRQAADKLRFGNK